MTLDEKLIAVVPSERQIAYQQTEFYAFVPSTVIGHKRIIPLGKVTTYCIRIRITDSRVAPTISFLGIYGAAE